MSDETYRYEKVDREVTRCFERHIVIKDPTVPMNPSFISNVTKIHPDFQSAVREAERLAMKYPGSKFFVAKLVASSISTNVITTRL